MIDNPYFVAGYVYDKPRIDAMMSARMASDTLVMASANPGVAGAWQRLRDQGVTRFSLRDAEIPLLGRHRRPYFQRAGTCVSRGVTRAGQASLDWAIVKKGKLLRPVELSFAPVYSLARHEFGQDRCGSGDGAIVSDAVEAVHNKGYATTELFVGLTEVQQEQLAVKYAAPGVGTPKTWQDACTGHTAKTMCPDSLELAFDCIASGYGLAYACNYVTGSTANTDGLYRLGSPGGHCRCFLSLVVDQHGVTQIGSTESWSAYPAAQPNDKYSTCDVSEIPCCTFLSADGKITLAPGECIVDANQFWNEIKNSGEIWAIGEPDFSPDSLTDIAKPAISA